MIDPASIPEFTGDLEQLDKDVSGLRGDAITIRDGGMHAHSRFQMLEGFYKAPEAGQLFASTWSAAVRADAFAGDLEKVADALDTFAYEIRPLVKRLKQLKADAFAFVDSVEGDDDWTEDEGKVDRHQQLWDGVNAAVAAFQEAERKASTTISGLVGGPKFLADDGSHTRNRKKVMYGYDLDSLEQAKELPWGSPVSQIYDALDFGHHFKSFVWDGLIVDNIWGGLKGLKTLTGLDGGDAADKAWGHLGDVVGGIGQYTIKPYDAFMDWAFGEDQDSPDEARQKHAAKDFGKSLVAWDMWSENPARASATVVFNGLTLGAVPAARVIKGGKAGAAAQGAAKIGEYLDPLSATFKVGARPPSLCPSSLSSRPTPAPSTTSPARTASTATLNCRTAPGSASRTARSSASMPTAILSMTRRARSHGQTSGLPNTRSHPNSANSWRSVRTRGPPDPMSAAETPPAPCTMPHRPRGAMDQAASQLEGGSQAELTALMLRGRRMPA